MVTPEEAVASFEERFGSHDGFRRLHAKGWLYRGTFTATTAATTLTSAAVFSGERHPGRRARVSTAAAIPKHPDYAPDVRGLAVKFSSGPGRVRHRGPERSPVPGPDAGPHGRVRQSQRTVAGGLGPARGLRRQGSSDGAARPRGRRQGTQTADQLCRAALLRRPRLHLGRRRRWPPCGPVHLGAGSRRQVPAPPRRPRHSARTTCTTSSTSASPPDRCASRSRSRWQSPVTAPTTRPSNGRHRGR